MGYDDVPVHAECADRTVARRPRFARRSFSVAHGGNAVRHFRTAMVQVGETVRLLSEIGDYPAGTEAVVVSVTRDLCEIDIEGHVLTIDCNAVTTTTAGRFANPS
jgi:hypothetical protein